jgi:hypothetical protein
MRRNAHNFVSTSEPHGHSPQYPQALKEESHNTDIGLQSVQLDKKQLVRYNDHRLKTSSVAAITKITHDSHFLNVLQV